jgi:ABC-2 type transport system ATP-binding protein
MQPVVVTEGLTKKFGRTKAVLDLDLTIEQGETFALVGKSDSGKSTVLNLLLDLVHPTSGRARVLGFDTAKATYQVHREVGWVPSHVVPPPRLTIQGWLDRARSFRRSEIDGSLRQRVIPLLDAALTDDLSELSQSELGVVALVAALQKEPELLLLDEAIISMRAQLDLVKEVLDEYSAHGGTILMTSRDLSVAGRMANRVGLLDSGSLIAAGTIGELRERGRQRLEIVFKNDPKHDIFEQSPSVVGAVVQGNVARVLVLGKTDPVVAIARQHGADQIILHEAGIDELVADLRQLKEAS